MRGIKYRAVQASSSTPMPMISLSGYPSLENASLTTAGLNSFITPSKSKNATPMPLMIRPAQSCRFLADTCSSDGTIFPPILIFCSAARDSADHQQRLFAIHNRLWQRRIDRFVRKIFLTCKKSQERSAHTRCVVANRTFDHGVLRSERIEHGEH